MVIIGIWAAVASPMFVGLQEQLKEEVCLYNLQIIERDYDRDLALSNREHSDMLFNQRLEGYGDRICPLDGVVVYVDGEVQCSVHGNEEGHDESEEEEDSNVPFL
ncbi:hypothetical protein JOC85_002534 [Bacillus mesophilus]|uniref:Uncharacterized protein n=1 Tax=Bacillus mesophilus TaxID=1808955 RepID=A0A6M0Q7R1_9BACI|nr:hypothetical protein [Bacillus mesophilus]MBM7661731.1 hypothetical protein [Bacillus mesophilus]NEY72391.1 hypothetical protein [Bacillus mesophilus]